MEGFYKSRNDVFNCNISNNTGYGIYFTTGTIQNSTFNYNGGGLSEISGTVTNCMINHNGSGMYKVSDARVSNSAINYNVEGIFILSKSIIENDSICYNTHGIQQMRDGSCTISNNIIQTNKKEGIESAGSTPSGGHIIEKNKICYNGIGIIESEGGKPNTITGNVIEFDSVGLSVGIPSDFINCNRICNNTFYDLKYTGNTNSYGNNYSNNYWCTTDSAAIAAKIYDGYDNTILGLVNYMPLDNSQCYLTVGLGELRFNEISKIFPNPSSGIFTMEFNNALSGKLTLINSQGVNVYSEVVKEITKKEFNLDLTPGVYFLQVETKSGFFAKKILIGK